MYSYRYAVGRYRNYQPGFHIVDISKIEVGKLLKYFTVLDIVIYDEIYERDVKITLDNYGTIFGNDTNTIVEFLLNNGDNTLNYSLDIPKNEYVYAKWESPYHKGFYPHPANINLANDRQEKLTADAAPDIRLIRDNYNYNEYKKLSDYSLFIMNGCFIRAEGNSTGLYLLGAGKDYQKHKKDIYISAINLERIGKVTTTPITKEMVRHDATNMGKRFFIDTDKNYNLENKTVWIVFNGQLIVDNEIVGIINKNTILLDMGYVDMMTHYNTYRQYTRTPIWKDQDKDNAYIINSLISENSFIITIDNPTIGIELEPMVKFQYPISHQTNERFMHPVMMENGLFPYCFRRTYGFGERIINTDIGHLYLPIIDSTGRLSDNIVYSDINKGQAGYLPRAYLFKITGIVQ